MTLTDVIKVKKMAENVSFMRLFFLKNQSEHISFRAENQELSGNKIELIDCVMAIYLFEITRIVRTGKHLYRKD